MSESERVILLIAGSAIISACVYTSDAFYTLRVNGRC